MIKVKLDEALEKEASVKPANMDKVTSDIKLLLDGAHSEDLNIMRTLKMDKNIIEIEANRGVSIMRERMETDLGGRVYSREEVRAICLDYNLRLLPIKLYHGAIDGEVVAKIKEFLNANKAKVNLAHDKDRFVVMAPARCFQLIDKPKPQPIDLDPILFYQIDVNGNHFRKIHKWGKDFTIARVATAFKSRNKLNNILHYNLLFSAMFFLILICFNNPIYGCILGGLALGLVPTGIRAIWLSEEKVEMNDTLWNSEYRR